MGVTSRVKHPRKRRPPSPRPSNHDATLAEVLEDYAAAYRLLDAGKLDGYAGKYVGIVNGAVVGAARDATRCADRSAAKGEFMANASRSFMSSMRHWRRDDAGASWPRSS